MNKELLDKLYVARALYACLEANKKTNNALIDQCQAAQRQVNERDETSVIEVPYKFKAYKKSKIITIIHAIIAGVFVAVQLIGSFIKAGGDTSSDKFNLMGIVFPIGMGVIVLSWLIFFLSDIGRYKSECKKLEIRYQQEVENLKPENDARVAEYNKETQKYIDTLEELQKRQQQYQKNYDIAEEAYEDYLDLNFVYKTYQSIIPICQFIQYLESGRCDALEGPNGCYNLYESELRQNIIINKLENIENILNRIEANQHEVVKTLQLIALTSAEMLKSAKNLESTSYEILENVKAIQACSKITAGASAESANMLRTELQYYN